MGWVVTKNGNDRVGATKLPGTSPERSRATGAAGEFTGIIMEINAGDSDIATLKLGGLDLVAIRGAPFKAPAARFGVASAGHRPETHIRAFGRKRPALSTGKAAERALVAPARQFSPLVPTAESPCDDDDDRPMTRKRPKCDKLT